MCPRFSPLGEFTNNRAHSNMFYGLRIHPEFYPSSGFCGGDLGDLKRPFNQVPASFNGLISYKNGMKGAIATQVQNMSNTQMSFGFWWESVMAMMTALSVLTHNGWPHRSALFASITLP